MLRNTSNHKAVQDLVTEPAMVAINLKLPFCVSSSFHKTDQKSEHTQSIKFCFEGLGNCDYIGKMSTLMKHIVINDIFVELSDITLTLSDIRYQIFETQRHSKHGAVNMVGSF